MPNTIIEYLHHHVAAKPDEVAFSFLPSKTEPLTELTFREFWSEALSVANFLKSKTQTGDKVLLLYPPNIGYVVAFYGCLLAGVIAVPAPLPENNSKKTLEIVNKCQPVLVLTTLKEVSQIRSFCQEQTGILKSISIFTSENSVSLMGALEAFVEIAPRTPAFLNYFSDSNNMNDEVTMTHRDIIENLKRLPIKSPESSDDVFVGWLPFFSDMDLIALGSQ
jgi:acyl-CoA synthetase (AMP-forming)/AMP-acid ligase II